MVWVEEEKAELQLKRFRSHPKSWRGTTLSTPAQKQLLNNLSSNTAVSLLPL
jgi:hypothetical protein